MKMPFSIFFGLVCQISLLAADTNQFFITDERTTFYDFHTNVFSQEQIERARAAPESRPAEEDPEGNWGVPVEGFQLSIRFDETVFTNGENVVADVYLRNVSDSRRKYYVSSPEAEMEFIVTRDGQSLSRKDEPKPDATFAERIAHLKKGSRWMPIMPFRSQRRFPVELNEIFDLTTNGTYQVYATRKVPVSDRLAETNVVSGTATFRIVDPPDSSPQQTDG